MPSGGRYLSAISEEEADRQRALATYPQRERESAPPKMIDSPALSNAAESSYTIWDREPNPQTQTEGAGEGTQNTHSRLTCQITLKLARRGGTLMKYTPADWAPGFW